MLPAFLESGHKRYKKDTSILIKWLSEKGKECGYEKPAGKGKTSPKFSSKELLHLAEAIAKSESPLIIVPNRIIQACVRAVSLRKRSTDYYKKQSKSAQDFRSDDGHSYFTSVMEEVLKTLAPRIPGYIPPSASANIFEVLETQSSDIGTDELVHNNSSSSTAKNDTGMDYDLEIPADEKNKQEEKFFALFCFFDDLHSLRTVIQKTWVNYLIGNNDIITASMITNTAFQLAIRTQEELVAVHRGLGNWSVAMNEVLSTIADLSGQEPDIALLAMSDEGGAMIEGSMIDWMFGPAYQLLDSFRDVLNPGEVPMVKRGHFGVYNPNSNRRALSFTKKHEQDLILLMEILPEFAILSRYKIKQIAEDELTRGLRQMCSDKQIPIWLVFATTAFLDIHHLMKDKVIRPFEDLQRMATHTVETLDKYFAFSRTIQSPKNWTSGVQEALKDVHQGFKHTVLDDVIFKAKKDCWKQIGEAPGPSEKFYLYKRHPTLCGMLAYRMQLEMQFFGIQLCTAWGTVIYPAHLYQALKHSKSVKVSVWPLMYRVIKIHGEDRIFVGGKPENIIDSFKQISLVLGYSAENFSANRRNRSTVISKNGPRGLNNTSALSEIFRRGLATDGSMALTMHNIEELFKEQDQSAKTQASKAKTKKDLRKEWASTKRLSSLELLEALGDSLPAEVTLLQFNYFKMHQESITLLRELKIALHADFEKYIGKNYIENESHLSFIVSYIITIASMSRRAAEQVGITVESDSRVLVKAAGVFELFLKNGRT